MQSFLTRHQPEIKGTLSGFDRIRCRGTLRWLSTVHGMMSFLGTIRVLLKDFTDWAQGLTSQLKAGAQQTADAAGRPLIYVYSSQASKEQLARDIAARDGVTSGLICVLTCVEPCHTFTVGPNREKQKLELRPHAGKCLHQYFYYQHPELGLIHLRLQTWLPMTIHVCLNGREWLANQLQAAGIGYQKRDNCFVHVDDPTAAQELLYQQLRTNWPDLMNGLLRESQPVQASLFGARPLEYYWSAEETEWATDVMFRSPEALAAVYPGLVRHAMQHFGSGDVLRFLGRKTPAHGGVNGHFQGEVLSDLKARPEGVRIKHVLNRNSLKMYDKQGSVLRVETTINDPRDMKVYRPKEGDPAGPKSWERLRKGVADLKRRTDVSQAANERYLEALAAVEHEEPLGETVRPLCQPVKWNGKRVRALSPLSPEDGRLLATVIRGEFALNGFRNRDLRPVLFGTDEVPPAEAKRQAAKVTRLLRLLRGHRLIRKVPKTHRYQLTEKGRVMITAVLAAQQAGTKQLAQIAA